MDWQLYRLCQQVRLWITGRTSLQTADGANYWALIAPSIVTTAPQDSPDANQKKKSTFTLPRRHKPSELARTISSKPSKTSLSDMATTSGQKFVGPTSANARARESRITFEESDRFKGLTAPPAYGDDSNSTLALPVSRLSESSRSEGSLGDHGVYATTTTTHTVSTTTTFFRLPRRKKNKGPLFPLPVKVSAPEPSQNASFNPRASIAARTSESPRRLSPARTPPLTAVHLSSYPAYDNNGFTSPLPSPTHVRDDISRMDFNSSEPSGSSSPIRTDSAPLGHRGRSSTKGSVRQSGEDEPSWPTPHLPVSGRTSSSTTGRASLGGLFNLSRLRQNSEPLQLRQGSGHPAIPGTPISAGSKSQSFSLSREPVIVPERQEGDTPAKYLIRLEEAVSRGVVATILSQSNDDFFKNVLRSYMRGFKFFGDPLDMSTRKLLMEVELPKETQQIDRVLQAFANRYHECNPGVYASPGKFHSASDLFPANRYHVLDEAYFIAFSILILHTDVFNKNNKHKMQKHDYTKNARGQGVADEILECFYDNISYTPFIHVEDDFDISGERIVARKARKSIFAKPSTDSLGKPSREPVDPYTLILDNRLDSLRPSLKDVMILDDHYTYLGTASSLNLPNLNKTFFKSGVLQIVSSRSRPEAFMSPETMANPADAHPGVVDIKITKVGILWRKDMKKKKARSPWQEWGAILTGAQLYFFRNTTWIKSLMHQHDSHLKHGLPGLPVIFKPQLEQFKPDVLMSTEDAVALLDTTYKKHKHALVFVRHGGFEETFLADNEAEMNDWLAKLNYASAFRTAGVRMRGLIGASTDGQKTRAMRRLNSGNSAQSVHTIQSEASLQDNKADSELALQIQAARRQIMAQKIAEADAKLNEAVKQLDIQLRNARHLQILAPIQNKTREQIVLAAGGMAAKIKWMRMEYWRTRCHREILAMDLEEDIRSSNDRRSGNDSVTGLILPAPSPVGQDPRKLEFPESYQTSPRATPQVDCAARPATQPLPTKAFNMDDVFESIRPSPLGSSHKSKASWELPPFSFQPAKSSAKPESCIATTAQPVRHPLVPRPSSRSVSEIAKALDSSDLATTLVTPIQSMDENEQEVLQEAGLVEPESPSAPKARRPDTSDGDATREKSKASEADYNEGRSRVRRSLHRTLRDSHPPSHHRSKKGKDSVGSAFLTEDNPSMTESEGLARGTGSFTVHGKKASVITFDSKLQNISPEERLRLRKQMQNDESKLSVPSAIEDEDNAVKSTFDHSARRASAVSGSSITTTRSAPFEANIPKGVQTGEIEASESIKQP